MNADGSIVIVTDLDNKKLEQELNRLTRKVTGLEDKLSKQKQMRLPIADQASELAAALDEAKTKLEQMQSGDQFYSNASISAQAQEVKRLQAEYNTVDKKLEQCDDKIKETNIDLDKQKEKAGAVAQQLSEASKSSNQMGTAIETANKRINKFKMRLREVIRSALIFTVITQALAKFRDWIGQVVKTNREASAAVARLKAALLTLAQPLVNVVVPAFTTLINVLTEIVLVAAKLTSALFGKTIDQSKEAAENLYNETEALESTGNAAKKAGKSLASFDEINKLSDQSNQTNIGPDFAGLSDSSWLEEKMGKVAGWVPVALMLGGIALVAIGAATANLIAVVAGLALLGYGVAAADKNSQIRSWVDTLGLNSVEEFVVLAVLLGGIAVVAIGAALGNILMVLAGLILIGTTIAYVQNSGMMQDWADTLGLSRAAQWITAALLIGGMALVVIGAISKNILMLLAGLGMLAAGVYAGNESGTLDNWWEALGIEKAESFITAALLIGGIALVVIGAIFKNILMVGAGLGMLAAGYVYGSEQGTLGNWWEALGIENVEYYITAVLLIGGIALVVFGIILANILMFIAGLGMLYAGYTYGTEEGTLGDWWDVLGLDKYADYITAAMFIGAMALVIFGVLTGNILMALGGIALFIAGAVYSNESGTSGTWWEALGLPEVPGWVSTALVMAGIALIAIGTMTLNPLLIIAGLGLVGASLTLGSISSQRGNGVSGGSFGGTRMSSIPSVATYAVPHLATGAVIPANREFLAVLGDQKSGTNYEVPDAKLRQLIREETAGLTGGGQNVTVEFTGSLAQLGRVLQPVIKVDAARRGGHLVEGA